MTHVESDRQASDHDAPGHAALLSQSQARKEPAGWTKDALDGLEARLTDVQFPCIFSKNAFKKKLIKFIFVEKLDGAGMSHLAQGLTDYVELSWGWNGRLDTAYPLIVFFGPQAHPEVETVAGYHAFGWWVLQELHALDTAPWPAEVNTDPHAETWSMCFNGMQLFCNMSNPGHRIRRSRNLGEYFALVINPRERFDTFAGDHPRGRKTRTIIRKAIQEYDGAPPSLQLGHFGQGGIEWLQYGLVEEQVDNADRVDQCPFTFDGSTSDGTSIDHETSERKNKHAYS